MRRRSPARWLAPLALVLAAVAVYVVVHGETGSDGDGSGPARRTATERRTATATTTTSAAGPRAYTVQAGDVLSAIAARHGTTVGAIERLNPSVDAGALHPGQRLRLP